MITSFSFIFFLCVIGGVCFWHFGAAARELAITRCKQQCQQHQLQFLDGTTVLDSTRLRRDAGGQIGLQRRYHFDFYDGDTRLQGRITIFRQQVTEFYLDTPPPQQPGKQANPFDSANETTNVIPFPKRPNEHK